MEEINENEEIPKKFYSKLNDPQPIKILDEFVSYRGIKEWIDYDESRNILAKLARNLKLIVSTYPKSYVKRCRDINYWMNEQIEKCSNNCDKGLSSESSAIYNAIKWTNTNINDIVCTREKQPYKTNNVEIMKKLDDYCEIRDDNGCNKLKDKNHCIKCNKYIEKKKEEFTRDMKSSCQQDKCEWGEYTFACRCTLNDMELTFPVRNCEELYKEPEIKKHTLLEIGFFVIFTPVGSILNRFRKRKYDFKRNIERVDDDRYSLYHSDRMPADSENRRYYIEYARPDN